jgi:hypothetical protein
MQQTHINPRFQKFLNQSVPASCEMKTWLLGTFARNSAERGSCYLTWGLLFKNFPSSLRMYLHHPVTF